MIKLLGIIDLLIALWMLGIYFDFFSSVRFTLVFVLYLGLKAWAFWPDFASFLDVGCAVYLIFLAFGLSGFLFWIVFIYFLQKGFLSLL